MVLVLIEIVCIPFAVVFDLVPIVTCQPGTAIGRREIYRSRNRDPIKPVDLDIRIRILESIHSDIVYQILHAFEVFLGCFVIGSDYPVTAVYFEVHTVMRFDVVEIAARYFQLGADGQQLGSWDSEFLRFLDDHRIVDASRIVEIFLSFVLAIESVNDLLNAVLESLIGSEVRKFKHEPCRSVMGYFPIVLAVERR